jgi:hypothetical protein
VVPTQLSSGTPSLVQPIRVKVPLVFNNTADNLLDLVNDHRWRTRSQGFHHRVAPRDGPKRHPNGGCGFIITHLIANAQRVGWPHATPCAHAVKMRLLAKDTGLLDIVAGVRLLASRLHVADALTITLGRRADPALSRDASNADYDPSDDL